MQNTHHGAELGPIPGGVIAPTPSWRDSKRRKDESVTDGGLLRPRLDDRRRKLPSLSCLHGGGRKVLACANPRLRAWHSLHAGSDPRPADGQGACGWTRMDWERSSRCDLTLASRPERGCLRKRSGTPLSLWRLRGIRCEPSVSCWWEKALETWVSTRGSRPRKSTNTARLRHVGHPTRARKEHPIETRCEAACETSS